MCIRDSFRVAPDERAQYLAEAMETMRLSRTEKGCIEYVVAPDPVEDDRVVLSERWETQADLDKHIRDLMARRKDATESLDEPKPVKVLSREILFFEATPTDRP